VTVSSEPAEAGTVSVEPGEEALRVDDSVTLTALAADGWRFDRWSGDMAGEQSSQTLTLRGDLETTAHFLPHIHELTVEVNGAGTVAADGYNGDLERSLTDLRVSPGTPFSGEVRHDTKVSLTAEPEAGWVFAGWRSTAKVDASADTGERPKTDDRNPLPLRVERALQLSARFVKEEHRAHVVVESGGSVDVGVYATRNATDSVETEIRISPNTARGLDLAHGETLAIAAVPSAGHRFSHWEGDITGTLNPRHNTVAGDLTVTAVFHASPYRILTFTDGAGSVGHTVLDGEELTHGGRVRFDAEPAPGWRFAEWQGDLSGTENPAVVTATEDLRVTARFTRVARRVETAAVGGGRVELKPVDEVADGATDAAYYDQTRIRLTAVPDEGRLFSHWEGDITGTLNPREHTVAGDLTVTAVFAPTQHELSVRTVGQGTVSRTVVDTVQGFPRVRLTATPAAHWHFSGYSGAVSGGAEDVYIVLNEDAEVTAEFVENRYEVNATITGLGAVRTEVLGGGPMVAGAEVRVFAEPERGWSFSHWHSDSSDTANPKTITISDDRSVTAVFRRNEWALLFYMSGDNELEESMLADINELEATDLTGHGVTALVLADRAAGHDSSDGNWEDTRLYRVRHDSAGINTSLVSERLSSPELGLNVDAPSELNLGSAATLSAFLDHAERAYAAEHTALVIWGHGSGYRSAGVRAGSTLRTSAQHGESPPTAGASKPGRRPAETKATSIDDGSGGDALLTPELGAALAGREIDVLGLDLCYGASVEIIYEVRNEVDLVVASQNVVDRDGWEYAPLLRRFRDSSRRPQDFAAAAKEEFARAYESRQGATISIVEADRIAGVHAALNDLSRTLLGWVDTTERQTQLRTGIFSQVEDFYETPGDLSVDLHHLGEYVASTIPAAAAEAVAVQSAVTEAVRDSWRAPGGTPNAEGLSLHYVPLDAQGLPRQHDASYMPGGATGTALEFVEDSLWVPDPDRKAGLLYRLWYEAL